MQEQNSVKVYVQVKVDFDENGQMRPLIIHWEDGTKYHIDRVSDCKQTSCTEVHREE